MDLSQYWNLVIIALISYIIGSIPTALIVSKRVFGFDIREKGSGNMGSTNAFRLLGWKWGLFIQVIDILKGVIPVVVVVNYFGLNIVFPNNINWFNDLILVRIFAGFFAIIGHVFTVFAGFRGGKGVNTLAGMLIGIAPIDMSIAVVAFILVVIFSGYISLGSMIAGCAFPLSLLVRFNIFRDNMPEYPVLIYFALFISVFLIFTHRQNIARLLKGNENKFNKLQLIKLGKKN
ncbi:MAG: glycerol-3-phosphate 1-O-acyltransferase PlsY [Candidatus Kapabacteria bacterium]|nr:glycerol-3-phosphate 1-O-acyltransferase PlsY [Candidatus Kapabacteria bacterium]